jgi:ElaB/YqjD/DUF883 family membrane-anchored ribosome-binding protein
MSTYSQNLENMAERAQDAAENFAGQAKETARRAVTAARDTLDDATDCTKEAVERATEYVRSADLRGRWDSVWQAMRRNPAPSIIGALAVGFILGASIRRSN